MCGIFGLFSQTNNLTNFELLYQCLKSLQHRGKDGYGICYFNDDNKISFIKNNGLIPLKHPMMRSYSCVGHLRYSTSGHSFKNGKINKLELQPLEGQTSSNEYCLAHNGNIPNIDGHDTTYLNNKIMNSDKITMKEKLIDILNTIPAAYSLIILTQDAMFAVRDRYGIRPLCIGKDKHNFYVSSESCTFGTHIDFIRNVKPGELVRIDKNGIHQVYLHPKSQNSLCSFEILYFANPRSFIDGLNIQNIRKKLGVIMGKKENALSYVKNYTVIGIPETGICSAKAYAKYLNLKYKQGIKKKDNETRTFIILDKKKRKKACDNKFTYDYNVIQNKNIIIVDDTIVRGNIIKSIIKHLKQCDVGEIHIRIPAPPVIDICELGIAITNKKELLMNGKTIEDAREELGVDSLVFLKTTDLKYFPTLTYNQCFTGYLDPIIRNFKPTT